MTRPATVALVESATQLLNVVEWAHATGETDLRIDVLAPRDDATVRQMRAVAELVDGLSVDLRVLSVRSRGIGSAADATQVARDIARADQLVVGDPFSRFMQSLLPLSRARRVVVVDDGTSTWEFVSCLNAGRPLIRWQLDERGPEPRAARATRFYSPSTERELTVFSCLRDARPVGAQAIANTYAWTRSWREPQIIDDEVDLIGVSLVDTGVVRRAAYLDAVARLVRRHGAVRYLPHRRESAGQLALIAAMPGVRIARIGLPIELALREGPVARHVVAFPSTAAHTLPLVLGDLDVHIEVRRVEQSWFTPDTTPHARAFVARIADNAPLPPTLESV